MYALNKKDQEIQHPVQLSSRQEILAVYLGGPKVQLVLKVKEMGEAVKRATQEYGKKLFLQMSAVGEDEELAIIVEAWEPHVTPLVKSMRVGTVFLVAFTPVPSPPALFAPVLNWMIRLNTYARICDVPAPGEPVPDLFAYFTPPRFNARAAAPLPPPPPPQQQQVMDGYGHGQSSAGGGYRGLPFGHRVDAGYVPGLGHMPDGYFAPNIHASPRIMVQSSEQFPSTGQEAARDGAEKAGRDESENFARVGAENLGREGAKNAE